MNPIRKFRLRRGLTARELVEALREVYPGYDKALHSKVEDERDRYGVTLKPAAALFLAARFGPQAARRENRRLPCRVACRVSGADCALLQQRAGDRTIQDYLRGLILADIEGGKLQ